MATYAKTKAGNYKARVRKQVNGEELDRARTFNTKKEAEAWAKELEAAIDQTNATGRLVPTSATLGEALALWQTETEEWMGSRPQDDPESIEARKRFKKDRSRVRMWSLHPLASKPLREIGQLDIEVFIDDRREDDRSDSTINNDLALLGRLYRHATSASNTASKAPAGWNWLLNNPVMAAKASRRLSQSSKRDRRLLPEEINALTELFNRVAEAQAGHDGRDGHISIDTPGGRPLRLAPHNSLLYIGAAFECAIECAMRREKLFSITWRWIDSRNTDRWNLVVPPAERGPENKSVPSVIAMSPRFTEIVRRLKGDTPRIGRALDEPIFGPLVGDRAYRLLKVVCEALGVEDFRWHDLRHEACSRLAESGWSIAQIQQISGHKTLEQLKRYIHLNTESIHDKFREDIERKQFEAWKREQIRLKAIQTTEADNSALAAIA